MNAASDALRKRFATLFRMWSVQLLSLRVCPIHWWEFPERLASSCHLVQPCRTSSDIPDPLGAQVSMGKRPPPAFWVAAAGSRSRQPWSRNFVQYAGDGFPPIVYWDVFRMHRVCIFPSVFHETKDPQWLSFLEHLAFSFLFLFRQNSVQDFGSLRP